MPPESSPAQPSGDRAPKSGPERRVVRMGKYEVVQHIATGGMGAVYRARDTEAGRDVALKVLPPELAARPAMIERFRREARSAAKLRHENIVTLLESGEINGTFYLAMEFVEGIDLHEQVKRCGVFDPEEARQIILQGARALQQAHEMGIVHRDIKPSNFLLTRKDGRALVKLLDFGLARDAEADHYRVTRAGTTVGTIDYMSPEQARDSGAADIRSDLYSLGSTWYHLLAGRGPFPAGGLGERLMKLMSEQPPDLRDGNPLVSDETWEIIRKLLAKAPGERYQDPEELIEALKSLEGFATARDRPRPTRPAKPIRRSPSAVVEPEATAPREARSRKLWYSLAAIAVGLLVGVSVVALNMPRGPVDPGEERSEGDPPTPPPVVVDVGKGKPAPVRPAPVPPVPPPLLNSKGGRTAPVVPNPVETRHLRAVWPGVRAVNVKALREEVERPWAVAHAPTAPLTVKIGRSLLPSPLTFRTLAEAFKAGEAGQALVVEIHDNGPLFELPVALVEGRDVIVRAATGYRPLILWDLQAASTRKTGQPLVFFPVRKGRLRIEGVEIALRWPEALANPATLLDVEDGGLSLRDCTISAAGKPRAGLTLASFRSKAEGACCRFTRCQVRGAGMTALSLDAPAGEVLIDGCLVVGGQQPLLRVAASEKSTALRVVRSTLVGGPTLLELKPTADTKSPALGCLTWDSLLTTSSTDGSLLSVLDGADARNVGWRTVGCVLAGWKRLLAGRETVGADHDAWRHRWGGEGDTFSADPWPEQPFHEPARQPASTYQPAGAVLYGASVDPEKPLGCDLAALPPARDNWATLALDPSLAPPELPTDDSPPAVPSADEGAPWTGGVVDLATTTDLGMDLAKLHAAKKLAPRVVLHLKGSGEKLTSPIRLKGVSLVLHFEEPADKDTPPAALTLGRVPTPVPLIDLDGGDLEVINGVLRVPDQSRQKATHVIKVQGGDVRLYKTRVEGPQQDGPEGYVAAISVAGSGEPAADRGRSVALNECVVLSNKAGLVLDGVGVRLAMRQCVVVAGTEAMRFLPGRECKGRTGMAASLTNVTFAAKRAVAFVGDAPDTGVPSEPIVVQARECVYLNPFPGRPSKAGLLVGEGEALARGLLLWQGEGEGFDTRLHFAAATLPGGVTDTKEGYTPWKRLWGTSGVREPREVVLLPMFDARRWPLDRLMVKMRDAPGANLERLGLTRKPASPR